MRKAVFWDFDGTLAESPHIWRRAVLKAAGPLAEEYGITMETLRPMLHTSFPWDADGVPDLIGEAWWAERIQCFSKAYQSFGVPKSKAEAAAPAVREIILSAGNYRVYPDAAATLAVSIYKGYRNYLLSNNYPELEQMVKQLWLAPFFSGYIVSGQLGMNKPERRLFDYALQMARFPEVAYMVGDNPVADMQGGRHAGMRTILVHAPGRECAQADFTVDTLTEALRCL